MPEGHSVHRIARQFARNFVGRQVAASSPQGRFVEGAAVIDGRAAIDVRAVGKQMFLEFDDELWLRVHLGMYGAWDFAGEILVDPTIASANGRMGQTNQRGTDLDRVMDAAGENSLTSIGAPRRTRVHVRMSEQTTGLADEGDAWPPPVVGQVRLRLLTDSTCADLRGPTACQLQTPDEMLATIAKLGPDAGDHLAEQRAVRIVVDELVDRLLGGDVLGQAVEVDEAGVAMGLHGAAAIDEHALHAGLRELDDLPDELGEVDAGADKPEHLPVLLDDAVDPDLGDAEIVVVVDVQMAACAERRRFVVPAVARVRVRAWVRRRDG